MNDTEEKKYMESSIEQGLQYYARVFKNADKDDVLKEKIAQFHFNASDGRPSNYAFCMMSGVIGTYIKMAERIASSELSDENLRKEAAQFRNNFMNGSSVKKELALTPEFAAELVDKYMASDIADKMWSKEEYELLSNPHDILEVGKNAILLNQCINKIMTPDSKTAGYFSDEMVEQTLSKMEKDFGKERMEFFLDLYSTPAGGYSFTLTNDIAYNPPEGANYAGGPQEVVANKYDANQITAMKDLVTQNTEIASLTQSSKDYLHTMNLVDYGMIIAGGGDSLDTKELSEILKQNPKEVRALIEIAKKNEKEIGSTGVVIHSQEDLQNKLKSPQIRAVSRQISYLDPDNSLNTLRQNLRTTDGLERNTCNSNVLSLGSLSSHRGGYE
ncbi:MAG: hypothetical protein IJ689_03730 [Alphaproteobacteria bacterium]|nr:hypothetical protein [Alphaproteobacteria bacterium]